MSAPLAYRAADRGRIERHATDESHWRSCKACRALWPNGPRSGFFSAPKPPPPIEMVEPGPESAR